MNKTSLNCYFCSLYVNSIEKIKIFYVVGSYVWQLVKQVESGAKQKVHLPLKIR